MSDTPVHNRHVSLHLSRVLDEIGLNTLTVKRRRNTYLSEEYDRNAFSQITGKNVSTYHFGSQTEGATTPGLNSDIDLLLYTDYYLVIQDWSDWQRGKWNLLMLKEDTAPGYVRLQVLRPDVPLASEEFMNAHCITDCRGRVFVQNTWLHEAIPNLTSQHRNGPARTKMSEPGHFDMDVVMSLHCNTWPTQTEEFITRPRRHGWPSPRLIQQAVTHGVFLVPVGYKLSPTEPLEWRISASLAERWLMLSLNIVHIKCYVVLKMLVKTFVEPLVGKCITSYHCKTALLYCTENTEQGFWREDNLLQCVTLCLEKLLTWICQGFCPQFMISTENLFAGKVTAQNTIVLQSIVKYLVESNGGALLRVTIDDLGTRLVAKLNAKPSALPDLGSQLTVELIGRFEVSKHHSADHLNMCFLTHYVSSKPVSTIHTLYEKIEILTNKRKHSDGQELKIIQTSIRTLTCWLGSLLASVALSRGMKVPRQAIHMMHSGMDNDMATLLKLASVFFCNGDLQKVERLTESLEEQFLRNEIKVVCSCYSMNPKVTLRFCKTISSLRKSGSRARLFAHCVRFSPQEIHCTPPALRNELCRSVDDDINHRHPLHDEWMALATVDCIPFMYYLQYLTFNQLGKADLQKRSLFNLSQCVREYHGLRHLETAWNLLGQCMELEKDPGTARECYRTSLEIRPRNNAANWHMQHLSYTAISCGFLPM